MQVGRVAQPAPGCEGTRDSTLCRAGPAACLGPGQPQPALDLGQHDREAQGRLLTVVPRRQWPLWRLSFLQTIPSATGPGCQRRTQLLPAPPGETCNQNTTKSASAFWLLGRGRSWRLPVSSLKRPPRHVWKPRGGSSEGPLPPGNCSSTELGSLAGMRASLGGSGKNFGHQGAAGPHGYRGPRATPPRPCQCYQLTGQVSPRR